MNHRLLFPKPFARVLCATLACALLIATPVSGQSPGEAPLPSIGGVGGGLISEQQENDIGRQVMISIRRSANQIEDPLVYSYLSAITYRLVPSTPLENPDLTLALIDSPAINAFAVPGNIVGVNGGLFLNAQTEQQFASVMAHELAHLSQRHFARRLEQQKMSAPLQIAGMLAGIVLTAVTQSDIGIAAIAGTQAMAVQNMLAYSRSHEQEADRVGLEILANAGMDPEGMPEMFQIMMRQNRLQGNQVPEYLSTHPLTQSRVSDTMSRAKQYPESSYEDSLEYHLVRARLQVRYARSADVAVNTFRSDLEQATPENGSSLQYGLAVALLRNSQPAEAETELRKLLDRNPGRITYLVTLAEALVEQEKYPEARQIMLTALEKNPGNYPITEKLATIEIKAGNAEKAAERFKQLTRQLPSREHLWLQLAEAEGMARNIVGVHRARAEYNILMGDLEAAERQLRQAQEKLPPGTPTRQVVTERLSQVSSALAGKRKS
jgi:beta-barrel assembly-enhancing protease